MWSRQTNGIWISHYNVWNDEFLSNVRRVLVLFIHNGLQKLIKQFWGEQKRINLCAESGCCSLPNGFCLEKFEKSFFQNAVSRWLRLACWTSPPLRPAFLCCNPADFHHASCGPQEGKQTTRGQVNLISVTSAMGPLNTKALMLKQLEIYDKLFWNQKKVLKNLTFARFLHSDKDKILNL